MSQSDEYALDCTSDPSCAIARGVLRLHSTDAYERLFAPIRHALSASSQPYTLDLRDVLLMNSSGIRALAGVVLFAKAQGLSLVIRVTDSIPWQRKTVASLRLLDPGLEIQAS